MPAKPFTVVRQEASKACFRAIYELTLQICSLTPADAHCSRGCKKCWSDIVPIWNKYGAILGCSDVFFAALYHIHWRQFDPNITSPDLKNLLLMVEHELLNDGYAFDVWRNLPEFRDAFNRILDSVRDSSDSNTSKEWHSHAFRRYLYSSTFSRVIYKGTIPEGMWSHMTIRDISSFTTARELYECCHIFEQVIRCLLPEAASWTVEWGDEKYILTRLQFVHGADFSKDYDDFDRLVKAVDLILHDEPFLTPLMQVKKFTFSMAQAIWGSEAEKKIEAILMNVRRQHASWTKRTRVRSRFSAYSHKNVINSWLYHLINEWYETGDSRLTPKMKSCFLKMALGI